MEDSRVLLIDCPDRKGLIANISGILFQYNLNVISNREFVSNDSNHFFMRTAFTGQFDESALLSDLKKSLPEQASIRLIRQAKKDIVIMVTKEHHCLSDLLVRHHFNELNANIKAVISNYNNLKELTDKFAIPYYCVSHEGISREEQESKVLELLKQFNPDYIVLAKYMRILSPNFVSHFPGKIINIHHSFLPAFIGANPYRQAFERGVKIIGATAHFVNDNLDEGPIIAQSIIPVDHTHSAKDMTQAGREIERQVLANSLKLALEDRIFISKNKTIIFD
ncbi:MAG TPA: formyltetrahydrofolate deformylase [Cytophagaceae bacterium]